MYRPDEISAAVEAARQDAHAGVDRSFDALLQRLIPQARKSSGKYVYKTELTDEDCRDPRNKNGHNLTPRVWRSYSAFSIRALDTIQRAARCPSPRQR